MYYRRHWVLYALMPLVAGAAVMVGFGDRARWLNTFGILVTIMGVFQLEISGIFGRAIEAYSDEKAYPYGPPSHFTRQMFADDHPDYPRLSAMRTTLFNEPRTGFWMVVVGCLGQLAGVWV